MTTRTTTKATRKASRTAKATKGHPAVQNATKGQKDATTTKATKAPKPLTGKALVADFKTWSGGFLPNECTTEQHKEYTQDAKTLARLAAFKPKADKSYKGEKIQATRIFYRQMPEFKNCKAFCFLVLDEVNSLYYTANTYGDLNGLRASYNPKHYQYELTEKAQKKIDAKLQEQGYLQIEEVTDFPTWATPAVMPKKSRKASK